jgi:hypothetical protein
LRKKPATNLHEFHEPFWDLDLPDFGDLFGAETEFRGADESINLRGTAGADDGRRDGGMPQHPGDRDFRRRASMP